MDCFIQVALVAVAFVINFCYGVEYPLCTNVVRLATGYIDITATLTNCTDSIPGSRLPPSYFIPINYPPQHPPPTVVNTSIAANSLINVDDITAEVTIDIFLRCYWRDPRIHLSDEFWREMNPATHVDGFDIGPYLENDDLPIWTPDIEIKEAIDINLVSDLMHLFPDGHIFWSRHLLVTLTQSQMDLHDYPIDSQSFTITLESFSYSNKLVVLAPINDSYITKATQYAIKQ